MIAFDLACECGNIFEGWFQDRRDFQSQQENCQLVCPTCGSQDIRKILSPVGVKRGEPDSQHMDHQEPVSETDAVETAAKVLEKIQEYVVKNFENVGPKLTEETLKMHYGVEEPRNIRGVATEAEEKLLEDEGIELLKIPLPPEDDQLN